MDDKPKTYIFQIFYDELTRSKLDKGFIPLDNTQNLRPDWAEYWPIRNTLLNQSFNSNDYIGFLSPSFFEKTWCTSAVLLNIIAGRKHDIYSMSPYFDQMALYFNIFDQGECAKPGPGLKKITTDFLNQIGINFDIHNSVSDITTFIFCNYFVAKYEFWKIWLEYTEKLFEIAEDAHSNLGKLLCGQTNYQGPNGPHQMKVFIIERLISLVLHLQNKQAFYCLNIPKTPFGLHNASNFLSELLACDALKGQYLKTNSLCYLQEFDKVRKKIFVDLNAMT